MKLPIVDKHRLKPSGAQRDRIRKLAATIRREQPQLDDSEKLFRKLLVQEQIGDSPTFHLDDFSEIPVIGKSDNSHILQQRARLRAVDGDFVAQSNPVEAGFPDYCEYKLGLGRIQWLYPAAEPNVSRQIAVECWQDRRIKHDLIQAVRHQGLKYIHPHVSTLHVWELADLLHKSTRLPVKVIGPTPALANWANDKIEFTRAAQRLLGNELVPHTESAFNFSTLSKKVMRLAASNARLGIKFPYGTGGNGNFLVRSEKVRGLSLAQIAEYLKGLLAGHRWPKNGRVLIDVWETEVVSSPSVQTWIPASGTGEPVIEGLFNQSIQGDEGSFVGTRPAEFPANLQHKIVEAGFMLAFLFQELGYVGRCSFDLILVGKSVDDCCVEFIECNARWGGTSIPMTLMNRLEVEQSGSTYAAQLVKVPKLDTLSFGELLRRLGTCIYDPGSRRGHLALMNPARIKAGSCVEAIAIAPSRSQVSDLMTRVLPARLQQVIEDSELAAHKIETNATDLAR